VLRRNLFQIAAAGALSSLAPAQTSSSSNSKARLRTALCAYSFRKDLEAKRMTYADVIRLAVDLDVDGVDMTVYWLPDTSDATLLPLRRLAYRNAVEIYSISVRTEMTKPPGADRDKEIAGLRKWVDVADKLGAGHIRVFGGKVPAGATEDQAAQWVADVLKVGTEYAGSKGIILGLENHGGITERADTVIKIVKGVNSPWLGINLDTGNFNKNAYKQIEMCLPYAVNAQLKTHIKAGEDGRSEPADWDRIVRLFAASGYKGYFALEYEENEDAKVAVPRYTKELNKLVAKSRA
jgi:L-ribulose-5-phosphate 3-epimerase